MLLTAETIAIDYSLVFEKEKTKKYSQGKNRLTILK